MSIHITFDPSRNNGLVLVDGVSTPIDLKDFHNGFAKLSHLVGEVFPSAEDFESDGVDPDEDDLCPGCGCSIEEAREAAETETTVAPGVEYFGAWTHESSIIISEYLHRLRIPHTEETRKSIIGIERRLHIGEDDWYEPMVSAELGDFVYIREGFATVIPKEELMEKVAALVDRKPHVSGE